MVEQVGALETSIRLLKWCGALSAIEWESSGNNQWPPRSTRPSSGARCYDVGVHFVNATYYLEGDGPLIFACFERLSAVSHAVTVGHYPYTLAIAREIANGHADLQNRLITQSKGLCSTWIERLSTEVQCPVPHKRPCFQGSTSPLPSPSFRTETRCLFPRRVKKTFHLWMMSP